MVLFFHCFQLGVREYFLSLEHAVIATLANFGVASFTTNQHGVWVASNGGQINKICALGELNLCYIIIINNNNIMKYKYV